MSFLHKAKMREIGQCQWISGLDVNSSWKEPFHFFPQFFIAIFIIAIVITYYIFCCKVFQKVTEDSHSIKISPFRFFRHIRFNHVSFSLMKLVGPRSLFLLCKTMCWIAVHVNFSDFWKQLFLFILSILVFVYQKWGKLVGLTLDFSDSFLRSRSSTDHEATAMMKAQFMSLWDGLSLAFHS